MPKRTLTIIIGITIILAQMVLFRNYLPFLSNKVVIEGQWCTCPHARVTSGSAYLKSITPDSLLKYDLDYSEIYFENGISTSSDPMGLGPYIISGQIVGKGNISEGDGNYYPLFRIDDYQHAFLHNIFKWLIWGLLLIELYVLYRLVKRKVIDA
jgi:hypothetical protein